MTRNTPKRVRFDLFELDLRTVELQKSGRRIKLQEQPAKLLALLATRPGELVTREEIQKVLWPDGLVVEFEHAINTDMKKIREALNDDPKEPKFIETLSKRGYRFIAKVEEVGVTNGSESAIPKPPVEVVPTVEPTPHQDAPLDAKAPVSGPAGGENVFTLPVSRGVASVLFLVIQLGYLSMYCVALYYWEELGDVLPTIGLEPVRVTLPMVLVSAMAGIAVRIYLFTEVAWAHPHGRRQFNLLFPLLLVLDAVWAASPLLAARAISFGVALAGVAGLAYVPFAQRTLIARIYPRTSLANQAKLNRNRASDRN